jgi:molybdate-binding protein
LVLASCDPAASLLAAAFRRPSDFRVILLSRSSGAAIELLRRGQIHAAGIHFATPEAPDENQRTVRQTLGSGFHLLRGSRWQTGLAWTTGRPAPRLHQLHHRRWRWIGREPGSAARRHLDELLQGRGATAIRRVARDHRGVAQAVRDGWADVGVCHRYVCEEAGVAFLAMRWEFFDWCVPTAMLDDPRIAALVDTLRSMNYRRVLADLPGYDPRDTGELIPLSDSHRGSA